MDGPAALNVIEPDILSGLSQIIQTDAFEITWSPLPDSDTPQKLIVELRVYDYETDTQNGSLELARLVTSANPTTGKLVIPAEQLQRLPSAPNTIDDDYNFLGAWGELNLILHQFRKVPYEDGELVIDFATVWSTPIDILPE